MARPDSEKYIALRAELRREGVDLNHLAELYLSLVWNAEQDQLGATNPKLPDGATTAERALYYIIGYLQNSPVLVRNGALDPLMRLHGALADLEKGRRSPMFDPVVTPRGGNPGTGAPDLIIGFAARAMDELIAAGARRNEAAKSVAKVVQPQYREVTATTVAKWRDGCREGDRRRVPDNAIGIIPRAAAA